MANRRRPGEKRLFCLLSNGLESTLPAVLYPLVTKLLTGQWRNYKKPNKHWLAWKQKSLTYTPSKPSRSEMRKRWELTLHCPERVKSTKLRALKEYNIT
jgi:hypothetical protein